MLEAMLPHKSWEVMKVNSKTSVPAHYHTNGKKVEQTFYHMDDMLYCYHV